MASRLRSGDRNPSVGLMVRIAVETGWTVDEQAYAVSYGHYGEKFEERMNAHHAKASTP
jgi:hypothetical protein